jgi:hypothetical protein
MGVPDESLKRTLQQTDAVPFSQAVHVLSGFRVLDWDERNPHCRAILEKLTAGLDAALDELRQNGIRSGRANEVGNYIEAPVKRCLAHEGFTADVPQARGRGRQSSGYPDILLELPSHPSTYLECKTYSAKTVDSPMRSFYCSPPLSKITRDAYHLLVGFEMEVRDSVFFPRGFRVVPLEMLPVEIKHELNSDNRTLYSACPTIVERHL